MEQLHLNFANARPFIPGSLQDANQIDEQPNAAAGEGYESWYRQVYFDQDPTLAALRLAWDQFQLDKAAGISPVVSGRQYCETVIAAQKSKTWGALIIRAQFDMIVDLEFPEGLSKNTN